MHETTADVRRDVEETRVRVSRTLAELQGEVDGRKEIVVERVVAVRNGVASAGASVQETVADFAREHPWYALAAAVGLGLVIARSGVDEAAARAAAGGAKRAADAAGAAVATTPDANPAVAHDPQTGAIGSSSEDLAQADSVEGPGLLDRLGSGIFATLGGNELLDSMRAEAAKIGRM